VNNDSETEKGRGIYKVIGKNGKTVRTFDRIMYSYFTNRPGVVLLARFPSSFSSDSLYYRINKASNEFILYNCLTDHADTVNMGEGRYLYPGNYRASSTTQTVNDSYRFRFTASGNLLVPFYQILPTDKYIQQIRLITLNNNRFDRLSEGSVSMSGDGRKFMTVEIPGSTLFKIYNENGQILESLNDIDFADFSKSGSLVYTSGRRVGIRDTTGKKLGEYSLPDSPEQVYADGGNRFIVADLKDKIVVIDVASGKKKHFDEKLISLNFDKRLMVTQVTTKVHNGRKLSDSLKRRTLSGTVSGSFEIPEGIQSIRYNYFADEVMLLTQTDRLILLNAQNQVKAGFQLTPNDLYGFSENGKRIFYVRNDYISVFVNDNKLINFFDFDASLSWADKLYDKQTGRRSERENVSLRKKYDLDFQREFF
jgi:hypothetical protein